MGLMDLFNTFKPKDKAQSEDLLLEALLGRTTITKDDALNIPSVKSCINFIADTIASLPIYLYNEKDGKAEKVENDHRLSILNDDTGDTLDAVQFWRAIITDYFLGKGGYAYIKREFNNVVSLHYVDESHVNIIPGTDPIFKDYKIIVNGTTYEPHDFLKVLRNTKNGSDGKSILQESSLIMKVVYNSLLFEENLTKKGGNKKGFLRSAKKLSKEAVDELHASWRRMYSNNKDSENIVVLNDGVDFQEASISSVEMQLNENKVSNSIEICKLFNITASIINGKATPTDFSNGIKTSIMPILRTIECALNRDFLLEKEKAFFYYAFDTKELLKGNIKERFEAYGAGLDANFLKIDEVRYMEDLPPMGLNWIKLGLDSVLYNPDTRELYTPNTNKSTNINNPGEGGVKLEDRDTQRQSNT